MKLFHLTPIENVESIQKHGLKADEDGEIFVFTELWVADTIVTNQVFAKHYAVFEMKAKGISGKIGPDEVAESSARISVLFIRI